MSTPRETEYTIPELFSLCLLESPLNPHYASVRPESSSWISSFEFFTGKKHEHFIATDTELLTAYTYPHTNREDYRTLCDVIHVTYVGDMLVDEQNEEEARRTTDIIFKAYASQDCEDSGSKLYRCAAELNARLDAKNLPGFKKRFLSEYRAHLDSMVRQAELRSLGQTLSLDEYVELRRDDSGAPLCFDLIEFALGVDLPDEVFEDQAFMRAWNAGADMVGWANDLYSYSMEQTIGLNINILTVFMKEYNITLQQAADHLGREFKRLMSVFLENMKLVRSYGIEVDANVQAYLQHVGYWVKGNLEWSFRSKRYFGDKGEEIRKTGVVKLMNKSVWSEE